MTTEPSDITISIGGVDDAEAAARLHSEQLTESFLATLGWRFLRVLYRRIALEPGSTLLMARMGNDVVGFVANTDDTGKLYRTFVRRDGLRAFVAAAPNLARHPRAAYETLRYDGATGERPELPPAEVLSMAVSTAAQGRGLGTTLLTAARDDLSSRGVMTARITVAAGHRATDMYVRVGFKRVGHTEVHSGHTSEVLVWP